ncbi:MAG: hypothetical protein LIO87_09535 [Eubacterium sp.]|nr:hypothetical protein [Eubacterium sp.]
MKGTTKIEGLGTVNLDNVSVDDGSIEVHIPLKDVDNELVELMDVCQADFNKVYPDVDNKDICFDVNIIFSFGGFTRLQPEFELSMFVWNEKDEQQVKCYSDIPVTLKPDSQKKIKRIIWDGLGKTLFNI